MHAILMFLNHLLEVSVDSSGVHKHIIVVFIDLKKTFNIIDHFILLRKFKNM